MSDPGELNLNRREVMVGAGACAALAAAPLSVRAQPAPVGTPVMTQVSFNVNGQVRTLELDTRTTLLDALREHLHLTGTGLTLDARWHSPHWRANDAAVVAAS